MTTVYPSIDPSARPYVCPSVRPCARAYRLKRVSGSVKTRTAGTYRFEEWWQLLHADCRGQAMYAWVKVHLPSLIAQLRKADQAEEALEMEDGDAEDVFYATGVPRELM